MAILVTGGAGQLKNLRKRYNKSNKYTVEVWSEERMKA